MASLIPFNRRNELTGRSFNEFQNMLDDFFTDSWPMRRSLINDSFKIDVQETDSDYLVEAELPGIQKENIQLSLDKGRLNIAVKQEEEKETEEQNYLHRERKLTSMSRSIYLANADTESDSSVAKLNDGILSVTVPKKPEDKNVKQIYIDQLTTPQK